MRSDIVDFAALARGPQIIGKRRQDAEPLGVAVVGYGYWGPNLVRNVIERPEFEMRALCEMSSARASAFTPEVPRASTVQANLDDVLRDPTVDAVIVATPPRTHHPIVKAALEAGKHVLVEKPLATTTADAVDLVDRATDGGLVLMPGHTFLYSPSVNKVRDLIREDVARRGLLRDLVADEPGQVPARRRDLRPRAARPLDPALLARSSRSSRSRRRPAASSRPRSRRPRSSR